MYWKDSMMPKDATTEVEASKLGGAVVGKGAWWCGMTKKPTAKVPGRRCWATAIEPGRRTASVCKLRPLEAVTWSQKVASRSGDSRRRMVCSRKTTSKGTEGRSEEGRGRDSLSCQWWRVPVVVHCNGDGGVSSQWRRDFRPRSARQRRCQRTLP